MALGNSVVQTDTLPSIRDFLVMKLASGPKRHKSGNGTTNDKLASLLRFIFHLAAFISFTIAGFSANPLAGWIVLGASCLVFSWLLTTATATDDDSAGRLRGDTNG